MVVEEVGREMAREVMFRGDEGVAWGVSTRVVDREWKVCLFFWGTAVGGGGGMVGGWLMGGSRGSGFDFCNSL